MLDLFDSWQVPALRSSRSESSGAGCGTKLELFWLFKISLFSRFLTIKAFWKISVGTFSSKRKISIQLALKVPSTSCSKHPKMPISQLCAPPGIEPGPRTSEARVLSIKLWERSHICAVCLPNSLVRGTGIAPACPNGRYHLKVVRLLVSPPAHFQSF